MESKIFTVLKEFSKVGHWKKVHGRNNFGVDLFFTWLHAEPFIFTWFPLKLLLNFVLNIERHIVLVTLPPWLKNPIVCWNILSREGKIKIGLFSFSCISLAFPCPLLLDTPYFKHFLLDLKNILHQTQWLIKQGKIKFYHSLESRYQNKIISI